MNLVTLYCITVRINLNETVKPQNEVINIMIATFFCMLSLYLSSASYSSMSYFIMYCCILVMLCSVVQCSVNTVRKWHRVTGWLNCKYLAVNSC
jgi:cell division protein FtsW (lipid II flippase)